MLFKMMVKTVKIQKELVTPLKVINRIEAKYKKVYELTFIHLPRLESLLQELTGFACFILLSTPEFR